ncbi:MAG: hypothetical protein KDD69_16105 [Bdellovibrionales bacterium]|nr:hypothetical protein [Bdellovibrionales bacterium]
MYDDDGLEHAEEPAIRKLLHLLLLLMIKNEYGELGIKPIEGKLQVTVDFDDLVAPEPSMLAGIVDRLKVMAGLEPEITYREQSGRFDLSVNDSVVWLRVTTLPSDDGEGVLVTREG